MSSMFGVGASWYKTKLSIYVIIIAGLVAIGTFFLSAMERTHFDGNYCASIFWTKSTGFSVEYWKQQLEDDLENIPKGVARICYKNSIYVNGWSQLEMETQGTYADWIQAHGAGYLEGVLTWKDIYNHWSNTIQTPCDQDDDSKKFCGWLKEILADNYKNTKEFAEDHLSDYYWHQVKLFYYQLEGLYLGWQNGAKRARSDLEEDMDFTDFLLLNAVSDMADLKAYYYQHITNGPISSLNKNFMDSKATVMLKLNQNNETLEYKLLLGHSSKASYSSMLRMQKRYNFHYHMTSDSKANIVPATEISFTGYPGILASADDFYIIKGRKTKAVISGIPMKNANLQLLEKMNLKNMLPLSIRTMAANRLGSSKNNWEKILKRHSATGSRQWILLDLNKVDFQQELRNDKDLIPGMVWSLKQLPGVIESEDITESLENNLYSNENLSEISITENITSLKSIENIFRKEAFRGDLMGEHSILFGNIDLKLFSYEPKTNSMDYHAISGPLFLSNNKKSSAEFIDDGSISDLEIKSSRIVRNDILAIAKHKHENHTPFKWSLVDGQIDNLPHIGHPDEFNFKEVQPKWFWNEI